MLNPGNKLITLRSVGVINKEIKTIDIKSTFKIFIEWQIN